MFEEYVISKPEGISNVDWSKTSFQHDSTPSQIANMSVSIQTYPRKWIAEGL